MALIKTVKASELLDEDTLDMLRFRKLDPEQFQHIADKFSCEEQSILWQCTNDKISSDFHKRLNNIVTKHKEKLPLTLYRGLSRRETKAFMDALCKRNSFCFNKVSSFSTEDSIAFEFAGKWIYSTNTIIKFDANTIDGCFDYHHAIKSLLVTAPESEFMNKPKNTRWANIDMVDKESEWMVQMDMNFRVTDYEKVDKNGLPFHIYSVIIDSVA